MTENLILGIEPFFISQQLTVDKSELWIVLNGHYELLEKKVKLRILYSQYR